MQMKFQLLIGGMLLATLRTGFGQPVITPSTSLQHQAAHIGTANSFTVIAAGRAPLSFP